MKKWLLYLMITIVVLVSIPYSYVQYNLYSLEKGVENYLINEKGYSANDFEIKDVSVGKLPRFAADVVFKDEPKIVYIYMEDVGEVYQIDFYILNREFHPSEINKDELIHYER